jgi:hypothetical protein
MKKARLVLLVLVLSVASSLPVQKAQAFVVCHGISNCELTCGPRRDQCYAGTIHPECAGNVACCDNALATCFACCQWF